MNYLTSARSALITALAGEPPDVTVASSFDAIKAFPALVVAPSLLWLDGTGEHGPGRPVHASYAVDLVVNNPEPEGGLEDIEDLAETILERIPSHWGFERADQPRREGARGGEISALAATVYLSTKYTIR